VAIACVEAIILSRLRKLVCTVSCCGALKGAQCLRADAELAAINSFCAMSQRCPFRRDVKMRCWQSARVLGACSKRAELGTSLLKTGGALASTRTPVKGGDP